MKNKIIFPKFTYLQYEFRREVQCLSYPSLLIAEISTYYPTTITLYISDGAIYDEGASIWNTLIFEEVDVNIMNHVKIFMDIIQKYGFINQNFIKSKNISDGKNK